MVNINVDTTYIIGNNGISRDAKLILDQLKSKNKITEIRFLNIALNKNRFVRRTLNLLTLLLNLHIPIGQEYEGVFYQPHLSLFKPGKKTSGWVIRLHDLFPITNPEWFRWWANVIFKRNLKFAVENGAIFLFSSKYSQSVFLSLYPETIDRVALAPCNATILSESLCRTCQGCIEIAQNPRDNSTLLAVGTIEPRKNYDLLVEFWKLHGSAIPGIERLLVIGAPGWKSDATQKQLSQLRNLNLIWIKNCCDGALSYFYQNSKLFISSSINEGFNLPALEARLNFGLPLVLSDIPVHHEVHGDNAMYFKTIAELNSIVCSESQITKRIILKNAPRDASQLAALFNDLK
jgi:glycosyltransferase involved in cell wall biosynthesis